jgi:hypothetical protein
MLIQHAVELARSKSDVEFLVVEEVSVEVTTAASGRPNKSAPLYFEVAAVTR